MRGGRAPAAAVAVVAVALLLAGCSGGGDVDGRLAAEPTASSAPPSSSAEPSSAPSIAPGTGPSDEPVATGDQAVADALGMQRSDFAEGYTLESPSLSNSLDVATLDHCGASYASEADRTARRERVLIAPDGARMGVFSQAVTYTSEVAAAQALDELTTAVASCADGTPVRLSGEAAVMRDDVPGAVPTTGLVPEVDRTVVGVRYESSDGRVLLRTVSLWQRQGRALVQLLLTHTDEPFTDADLERLGGLGAKVAAHLEDQAAALS